MRLQEYILSDAEWLILEQLHPILNIFLHSTLKMEQESVPLIYQVIPEIDKLMNMLSGAWDKVDFHPAVRLGAWLALKHLNKYYEQTDDSIIYQLAMGESYCVCCPLNNKKFSASS